MGSGAPAQRLGHRDVASSVDSPHPAQLSFTVTAAEEKAEEEQDVISSAQALLAPLPGLLSPMPNLVPSPTMGSPFMFPLDDLVENDFVENDEEHKVVLLPFSHFLSILLQAGTH